MTSTLATAMKRAWATRHPRSLGFFAAFVYFVTLGGGSLGEQLAVLRGVNFALGAVLIATWIRSAREHDAIDRAVVLGVVLYSATALLSSSPRLSLDAAFQGMAYAALFWYARRLLAHPRAYSALIWTFGSMCIGLVLFFAIEWGSVWLEWARLTGFREIPPLSLPLPTGVYLHRHDVALLVLLLAPALFLPNGLGRLLPVRVLAIALIIVVLFIDGSRTVLVTIAGAAVVAGAIGLKRSGRLRAGVRLGTHGRLVAGGIALATVAAIAFAAEPLLARMLEFGTLSARGALWSAAATIWLDDPLSGSGPGTFLFAFFETGYYDANAYFPRNPDGAAFMLLAETGLLGLVGLAIPAFALIRGRLTRTRPAALLIAGPVAFVIAGVGSVPADFGYLVVPSLLWLAAAYPRRRTGPSRRALNRSEWRAQLVRRASLAALGVVTLALTLTTLAAVAYEDARGELGSARLSQAAERLSTSVALDPRFALYSRALGTVRLAQDDPAAAIAALASAESAEWRDPVTLRLQTLARVAQGDTTGANRAAARAVEMQASQPLNQVAGAIAARASGDYASANRFVNSFVASVPSILGAADWPAALGDRSSVPEPDRLITVWARNPTALLQPATLAAMAQADRQVEAMEAATRTIPHSRAALRDLFRCELESATQTLLRAPIAERALPVYWEVRILVGRVLGEDVTGAVRLGQIAGLSLPTAETYAASPLGETWAYRRLPFPDVALPYGLPPADGARGEWLRDPRAAAGAAGVEELAQCQVGR